MKFLLKLVKFICLGHESKNVKTLKLYSYKKEKSGSLNIMIKLWKSFKIFTLHLKMTWKLHVLC